VNNSSVRNTVVLGTCVKIVEVLCREWFVSASGSRIARISCARVVIITRDWFVPA